MNTGQEQERPKSEVSHYYVANSVFLVRAIVLCFYPVVVVALGTFALLFVPQVTEALRDSLGDPARAFFFLLGWSFWVVTSWYVSRALLLRRATSFNGIGTSTRKPAEPLGYTKTSAYAATVVLQLPRWVSIAAWLPITLTVLLSDYWLLGGIMLVSGSLWTAYTLGRDKPVPSRRLQAGEQFPHVSEISLLGKVWVSGGLLLAAALLVAITAQKEVVARALGAPALLLFAMGTWALVGGMLFSYWPKSRGLPPMPWLPLLIVLVASLGNDNHDVRLLAQPSSPERFERLSVSGAFKRWLLRHPADSNAPIVLVAAAGGASRAAHWATLTLAGLDEATDKALVDHIFAISAVSGGSLGASAFVASIAEGHRTHNLAVNLTCRDHLATLSGFMFFSDLLQRFLPFSVAAFDRSRALEEVWVDDWASLTRPSKRVNPWNRPFLELHARNNTLPHLVLNSSSVRTGERVLQSSMRFEHSSAIDLFQPALDTQSISLSTAVHNSARFPYASPPGHIRTSTGEAWDSLVDGGYIESGGALSLLDILAELESSGLLCDSDGPAQSPACVDWRRIRVVLLRNQPASSNDWFCPSDSAATEHSRSKGMNLGSLTAPQAPSFEEPYFADLFAPPRALLAAGGGRAKEAQAELLRWLGGCGPNLAEIYLPERVGREPAMNWMLNATSRQFMSAVVDDAKSDEPPQRYEAFASPRLRTEFSKVRNWFDSAGTQEVPE